MIYLNLLNRAIYTCFLQKNIYFFSDLQFSTFFLNIIAYNVYIFFKGVRFIKKIVVLKEELENMFGTDISYKDVLKKSQELDVLIVREMKKINKEVLKLRTKK